MISIAAAEGSTAISGRSWTLYRDAADEWCSLASSPSGWALRIYAGEFTVHAEGGPRPDDREVEALRAHLRSAGWTESPDVARRPARDRRGAAGGGRTRAAGPAAPAATADCPEGPG